VSYLANLFNRRDRVGGEQSVFVQLTANRLAFGEKTSSREMSADYPSAPGGMDGQTGGHCDCICQPQVAIKSAQQL